MVVKLNWLVRSVSCATRRRSSSVERREVDLELQAVDEVLEGQRLGAQLLALELLLVQLRAARVFLGGLAGVELPDVPQQALRRARAPAATGCVSTSGQPARTSAHSTGLSSRKTKLSSPRLSRAASVRRFCDFGCQLIMAATTCSRRRPKSGRVSNTRQTSASSFLLHRHTSTPLSVRRVEQSRAARGGRRRTRRLRRPLRRRRRATACCRSRRPRPCGPARSRR